MSLEDGLAEAQAKARGAGISIEGGVEGGIFHGVAEGRYSVEGRTLCLQVEKKPAFVTWGLVEMGLRQVFGDVNVAS
jgi:hypothetical protein